MTKKYRKPKSDGFDRMIDIYYEQYSTVQDPPVVYVRLNYAGYDSGSIKEMRNDAKFLIDAANWMEQELKKGKIR